ncbi:MAG TPA: S8 family serine peptidase [Verrucomicrobiae bacterium]|nr:S8 family serine peptidase [Verrucomicrobiae bacterium]
MARRTPPRSRILIPSACLVGAVALLLPVAQAAPRPEAKIGPALTEQIRSRVAAGSDEERLPVIVQTWGSAAEEARRKVEEIGGLHGEPFTSIHGFPALVPARMVMTLANEPHIRALSYDWPMEPQASATRTASPKDAPAPRLSSLTGSGVTIAVLDSGIALGSDLVSTPPTIAREIDIVEPDGVFADSFGHGTLVAGVIAGSGFASSLPGTTRTFRGIAPGARLISVKVVDHDGGASVSSVLAGTDWVLRNREVYNVSVMNISLGHPVDESFETDPLCQAVEMAWHAGIVVVVSAGNSGGHGYATITSPANDPTVITVGAIEDWRTAETSDDLVASFSSRGPTAIDGVMKPDIVAAGSGVVTLRSAGSRLDTVFSGRRLRYSEYTEAIPEAGDGDSPYVTLSGTSLAAARVSGAAAILIQQDPKARPDDVKARLMIGASKMNDSIVARGSGLLDVNASLALGAARVASGAARSPRLLVAQGPDGRNVLQLQEIGTAWGDPTTWSSEQVWGTRVSWGLSPQWLDGRVWRGPSAAVASGPGLDASIAVWGSR